MGAKTKSTTAKTNTAKKKPAVKTKASAKTTSVRSRAKPDAMELWSHNGRLAEAMRAGGYKMTPEAFAAASMDTCLQGDDVEVRIVDGARAYSHRGKEFATLALDSKTLILRFAAPKKKDDLARVERFYRPVAGRPGWLEFGGPRRGTLARTSKPTSARSSDKPASSERVDVRAARS